MTARGGVESGWRAGPRAVSRTVCLWCPWTEMAGGEPWVSPPAHQGPLLCCGWKRLLGGHCSKHLDPRASLSGEGSPSSLAAWLGLVFRAE